MSEAAFETWGVDDSPVSIEYSLVVLEEIRHQVSQGLLRFSRGGIEVGGVMYGTREGRKIRIQAIRPIPCDHANGPSFVLSAEDRTQFEAQLAEDSQDPHLQGLTRVGWFVSHTRGELTMTQGDLEMFSTHFRDPWQVTLVIRPGRGSAMRAAFFVWEQDGTVRTDHSYKEFQFPDRLAGVVDTPSRAERTEARAGFRSLPPLPVPLTPVERPRSSAPMSVFEGSQYMPTPMQPERKKLPWIVGIVGGLGVLGVLAVGLSRFYMPSAAPESLGLVMTEAQGQLRIEWNNSSKTIVRATKGSLNITDGAAVEQVPLTRGQLSDGLYLYTRKGGEVEVRMTVDGDGGSLAESSRFLGRPPVAATPAADIQVLEDRRKALETEVEQLKAQNAALNDRIQQLERTQRILEIRLGIPDAKQ